MAFYYIGHFTDLDGRALTFKEVSCGWRSACIAKILAPVTGDRQGFIGKYIIGMSAGYVKHLPVVIAAVAVWLNRKAECSGFEAGKLIPVGIDICKQVCIAFWIWNGFPTAEVYRSLYKHICPTYRERCCRILSQGIDGTTLRNAVVAGKDYQDGCEE